MGKNYSILINKNSFLRGIFLVHLFKLEFLKKLDCSSLNDGKGKENNKIQN